ncbi:MAG: Hint domain-containing protein [Paracoccaceae bacterium]
MRLSVKMEGNADAISDTEFDIGLHTQIQTQGIAAMSDAYVGTSHGLVAGTHVASSLGWRAVDAIAVGDEVLTFDNAMQPVVEIRRDVKWRDFATIPESRWPVTIPAGVLGNRRDLTVLHEQGILVESNAANDPLGDPFAVVPAMALDGSRGIQRVAPQHQVEAVTLFFEQDQVIYIEGGTLAYCPHPGDLVSDDLEQSPRIYDVLSMHDSAFLVECMVEEDKVDLQSEWSTLAPAEA